MKIDPTLIEAYPNLGRLYHIGDQLERAEACYRSAIQHGPDEGLGYFNLAGVLRQKGDLHGAIAAYTSAIQRQPDLTEAHEQLALLYDGKVIRRWRFAMGLHHINSRNHMRAERALLRDAHGTRRPDRLSNLHFVARHLETRGVDVSGH